MSYLEPEKLIRAEEWFVAIEPLLREGYQFKICPTGRSMVPFLCGGRDEAVLSIPDSEYKFKRNDIVLYKIENGLFVLHRICRVDKKGIYTLGDSNTGIEGPLKHDEILALVDYIIRKGKIIRSNDRMYIILVSIWRFIRPFRPAIIKLYAVFRRLEKKIKNGKVSAR